MAANKRFIIIFFLFSILISSVYSTKVEIDVDEETTLTKLLNGKYSLQTNGILTIYNPSNVSKVYEANFPIELDSLIGITKKNVDITSNRFDFTYNNIKGYIVEPNQTVKVGYNIFGILDYNIYSRVDRNSSIFEYYVKDFNLVSKLVLNLNKPLREGFYYNEDNITQTPDELDTARLVSAQIQNPTDFDYIINEVKLFRTNSGDPMFADGKIVKIYNNITIDPFEYKVFDFYDYLSFENSVYWVSSDLYIKNLFTSSVTKNYAEEKRDNSASGGGGGYISFINNSLIVKKETDKTIIQNGEQFKVILRVINPTNYILNNLTLYDDAPVGYSIEEVSHEVKISKGLLTFNIDKIEEYGTYLIEYTLIPKLDFKGITYLKPAKLTYLSNEYFSEGVLLVNDLLPDEKVFVQKEIEYIDDDFAQITIKVKNLGNHIVENILVSDDIDSDAILKEISKVFFERGVWKIKMLKPGDEWEVTYLVSRDSKLNTLPNIFGIEKSEVYGTLVFSEEVITLFKEEPRIIEKVGMSLAVGFLIIYLLF